MNEIKQHTPLQSILLHLIPGVFIVAMIFIFSNRSIAEVLGFDGRLGPIVGYLLAILFGIIIFQTGVLFIAAKRVSGKTGIRRILSYTDKSRPKQYLIFVPLLILYFLLLFVFVAPIIQPYIVETFFSWYPDEYNFQLIMQDPSSLAGYYGVKTLVIIYILLSGLLGPLVEELYFRGYLLPRMANYSGRWAPLLNTVLFSLYHFFSPWENLIRIVALYPVVHLVWKTRNIRFGILVHVTVNTIGGIILLTIFF